MSLASVWLCAPSSRCHDVQPCSRFLQTMYMLAVAVLLVTTFPFGTNSAQADEWSAWDDAPYADSTEVLVADGDGNVLYARNSNTPMAMASTTKVMTAIVALESGVPLDTEFTITDSVRALDPASSIINCQPGQTMTLSDLLWGLLVHSGNDAAVSIAECIAGSEAAFVDMMNAKALELGLANTHFANAHGLDAEGHYSSAADLVALGRYAMENPVFASIVGSASTEISMGGELVSFSSTDALLNVYPGMRGIKTGYTGNAGCAFLGVASRGGQTIYVAVLGAETNDQRWADVERLLDWAFSHCETDVLLESDANAMGYRTCADRFGWSYRTTAGLDATALSLDGDACSDVSVSSIGDSLVSSNDAVGSAVWSDDGETVSARAVVADDGALLTQNFGPFVSDIFYGTGAF